MSCLEDTLRSEDCASGVVAGVSKVSVFRETLENDYCRSHMCHQVQDRRAYNLGKTIGVFTILSVYVAVAGLAYGIINQVADLFR